MRLACNEGMKNDLATEFPERRTKMRKQCENVSRAVYAIIKMCVRVFRAMLVVKPEPVVVLYRIQKFDFL